MSARALAAVLLVLSGVLCTLAWRNPGRRVAPVVAGALEVRGGERPAELVAPPATTPVRERGGREVSIIGPDPTLPSSSVVTKPVVVETDELVGCVLHGSVLDAQGAPITRWQPTIQLTDAAGERVHAKAAEDGHFSLAGLAPGEWTLRVGATGYRELVDTLVLSAQDPIVRRDFTIEKAPVIAVRVLAPDGEELRKVLQARAVITGRAGVDAFPVATLEAPGATIPAAQDAGNNPVGVGSFWDYGPLAEAAGPGSIGVLVLRVDPPVHVSLVVGARVIATQRVEPGAESVTFVVDPDALLGQQARVRARFLSEETGEPLQGSVDLTVVGNYRSDSVRDGSWESFLPPGRYTLSFWAQGYARIPHELELEPGEDLDLGELRIPRELTIEGHLLDEGGNPVAGRLVLGTRDASGRLRFDDMGYETDRSGLFRIFGLVPGQYVLRTEGDDEVVVPSRDDPPTVWVSGNVPVSTLGGSVTGFDLHLVRGGILVVKGAATLPAGTRCKVLDGNGDLLRYSGFYPGFVPRFVLPPGPCTFVLCDEAWAELERHPLTIGAGVDELDLSR